MLNVHGGEIAYYGRPVQRAQLYFYNPSPPPPPPTSPIRKLWVGNLESPSPCVCPSVCLCVCPRVWILMLEVHALQMFYYSYSYDYVPLLDKLLEKKRKKNKQTPKLTHFIYLCERKGFSGDRTSIFALQ